MQVVEHKLPYKAEHRLYRVFRRYGHPEQMNPFIIDVVSDELADCKTIYDPFAGVGTTMLLALRGRHYIILGEVEEQFVAAMQSILRQLGLGGCVDVVHQDSTHTRIRVDCVFTSPPFLTINRGGGIYRKGYYRNGRPVDYELPFRHARVYGTSPANLSNVKDARYWAGWRRLVERVEARKWIIHGKDIVRHGRIVELWRNYAAPLLDTHTVVKRIILRKSSREVSFWQRLMRKRGLPVVDYEWLIVLVEKK